MCERHVQREMLVVTARVCNGGMILYISINMSLICCLRFRGQESLLKGANDMCFETEK